MNAWDDVRGPLILVIAMIAIIVGAIIWTAAWSIETKANCMEACGTARLEFIDGVCHCATEGGYVRAKEKSDAK